MVEDEKPEEEEIKEEKEEEKSIIVQAQEERKLMDESLQKIREEREKLEKLQTDIALGGRSIMGEPEKELTDHEKYVERAKERYKGSGRDPTKGFTRQF